VTDLSLERKSLGVNTIEELLQISDEFDAMAARAATRDAEQALRRLATRFRIFAASRAASHPSRTLAAPGEPAPPAGRYELRNVLGTHSGG
jgi:hypothetical protein